MAGERGTGRRKLVDGGGQPGVVHPEERLGAGRQSEQRTHLPRDRETVVGGYGAQAVAALADGPAEEPGGRGSGQTSTGSPPAPASGVVTVR
ncbi:hypothetical protein San01_01510 [Streptomyces angustmyceticus]|uniref:Uncharacterized protein n=1 Tax=Streptomyces angustmyceticus TaxID=285578 RepID=A0A5J4LC18_9ACTN|nr:hypothetical protein San01_01510 [Streptomyces angustmyceticus]